MCRGMVGVRVKVCVEGGWGYGAGRERVEAVAQDEILQGLQAYM